MSAEHFPNADVKGEGEDGPELDIKTEKYIQELLQEKHHLSPQLEHASRLLQHEIDKTLEAGRSKIIPRYLDVYHERLTKLVSKVYVPVKEHPNFNFVGKLLGPQGITLKRLQQETQCKMAVLGRGSMKDKSKEEELRQSLDTKFAHLFDDLHVEITAFAPPAEAYARIAYALAEIRKYLVPDSNDDIALQQQREMEKFLAGQQGPEDRHDTQMNQFNNEPSFQGQRERSGTANGPPTFSRVPSLRGSLASGQIGGAPRGGGVPRGGAVPRGGVGASRGGFGSSRSGSLNRGGSRGGRGGTGTGMSFGVRDYGGGGQERSAPQRGGMSGRGRGVPRGRGGASSASAVLRRLDPEPEQYFNDQEYDQPSYVRRDSSGITGRRGFTSGGGGGGGGGEGDFQRRGGPSYTDNKPIIESGRGQWIQRGGISRYAERSAPYSRRN